MKTYLIPFVKCITWPNRLLRVFFFIRFLTDERRTWYKTSFPTHTNSSSSSSPFVLYCGKRCRVIPPSTLRHCVLMNVAAVFRRTSGDVTRKLKNISTFSLVHTYSYYRELPKTLAVRFTPIHVHVYIYTHVLITSTPDAAGFPWWAYRISESCETETPVKLCVGFKIYCINCRVPM